MKIGRVETTDQVMIVAEVGNNHEGNAALAEELIDRAAEAGADAVKFQTFKTEHLVRRTDEARFQRLKSFELSQEQFMSLAEKARAAGILFLSTPFDLDSARFLEPIVPAYKIASGDNNFMPLIGQLAKTGKPLILSTGLATIEDLRTTTALIRRVWAEHAIDQALALLHCVSSYPTPPEQANLLAIATLRREFEAMVPGYSDHTMGIEAAVLSVGLGARIIEKHFTIDQNLSEFRDHKLSADPAELAELVRRVREAEMMLGAGTKAPMASESLSGSAIRRSIVAGRDLPPGHVLAIEDLSWLRPGDGLSPGMEDRLIGRTLVHAMSAGETLTDNDVR